MPSEAPAFDVHEELNGAALAIVGRTMFSYRHRLEGGRRGWRGDGRSAAPRQPPPQLADRPGRPGADAGNLRFQRAAKVLDDVIYGMIQERRASGRRPGRPALHAHRRARRGVRRADERQAGARRGDDHLPRRARDHRQRALLDLVLLSKHPDVERRLHVELDEVLGGRTPSVPDLEQLPYTRMVIEESMRHYPPAWAIGAARWSGRGGRVRDPRRLLHLHQPLRDATATRRCGTIPRASSRSASHRSGRRRGIATRICLSGRAAHLHRQQLRQ